MNRTLLLRIAVGLLALVAVFGTKALTSHLRALRREVRETVREVTPSGFERKRIEALLQGMSAEIAKYGDKLAEIEATVASERAEVRRIQERFGADGADLRSERQLLAQAGGEYLIQGGRYTRGQVEASATARIGRMQRDQAAMDAKKAAIEALETAIRQGREQMQAAIAARDQKVLELERLGADLASAELQKELLAMAGPLRQAGSLVRSGGELSESMKAFGERVRQAQREARMTTEVSASSALISHGDASAGSGLVEQIDRMLGGAAHEPTILTNAPGN